ncbi:MAG: YbaK/EbsC family protein [Candidatus Nanosalina sp.]
MKADRKLDRLGFEYEEVVQSEPTKSCDDAARERGLETRQIVKSLIVESEGEKFHILLPGDRELSESKFGSEYRMIPPEESEKITGFESGTVHPFSTKLNHVADERIFENGKVSHTVGEKQRGIIIDSGKFLEALKEADFSLEIRDIAVSTSEDYIQIEGEGLEKEDAKFIVDNGFRKDFLEMSSEFNPRDLLAVLRAFHREEKEFDREVAEEILERAENHTHIQRMLDHYSSNGELPEKKESFDLEKKVLNVLGENPEAVEDLKNGKDSAMNYLIGQLMQDTQGKADASKARDIIEEKV